MSCGKKKHIRHTRCLRLILEWLGDGFIEDSQDGIVPLVASQVQCYSTEVQDVEEVLVIVIAQWADGSVLLSPASKAFLECDGSSVIVSQTKTEEQNFFS